MPKHVLIKSAAFCLVTIAPTAAAALLNFERLWTASTTGAEIGVFAASAQRVFITNAEDNSLDVIDAGNGNLLHSIDTLGSPNSVAYCGEECAFPVIAVAVEGDTKQMPGFIRFYRVHDYAYLGSVEAGALPDMVTFTPDGRKVLVANEGEPNDAYDNDPEGSVTIIDISGYATGGDDAVTVKHLSFSVFNDRAFALVQGGVRIFGPNATVGQDIEPEYITVSDDSKRAWVGLQENNAIAEIDIDNAEIVAVRALGSKRHRRARHAFDASNRDDIDGNLQRWPVRSLYMPDAIAQFTVAGETFIVTANEGDARDYDGFSEEARVADLALDPEKFPDAELLQADEHLGRLKTTLVQGDTDGDGDFDSIYAYGGRSFSIWSEHGARAYDSGNRLARRVLSDFPEAWDDGRSDDKGGEPEALTIGHIDGRPIAFVGLERYSVVLAYDLSNPQCPRYLGGVNKESDISPEGLQFISAEQSGRKHNQLLVVNEVSATTSLYSIGLNRDLARLGSGCKSR
ncbi:MAG: choice-of-anchor I family protein [Pseudomonadota bacterium]